MLGLGYPEVIIRFDGESSIVALSRRVGEKLREAGVKSMHNTSPVYDSISAGHAESGVGFAKEKVRKMKCVSLEFYGVTNGKSHVPCPWCVRFAARIFCRSRPWNGWNDRLSQSLYGRSNMPRRFLSLV